MFCDDIFICAALTIFIVFLVLFQRKFREKRNFLLGAIILIVGLHYILLLQINKRELIMPWLSGLANLLELIALPVTYFFLVNQLNPVKSPRDKLAIFASSFLISLIGYLVVFFIDEIAFWRVFKYSSDFLVASELLFIFLIIKKDFKVYKESSLAKSRNKKWVIILNYALFVHAVLMYLHLGVVWLFPNFEASSSWIIENMYYVFVIYIFIYLAIRYPQILHGSRIKELPIKTDKTPDEKLSQIAFQLDSYMLNNKPYLDPNLSLNDFADAVDVPSRLISEVVNNYKQVNFYDYCNDFRVAEFLDLAQDPTNQNKKIIALAYEAGFKSKSTFNDFFKKKYGQSPSKYLKSLSKANQV